MSSVIISDRCVFPRSMRTVKSTQQHHDLINEDPSNTNHFKRSLVMDSDDITCLSDVR